MATSGFVPDRPSRRTISVFWVRPISTVSPGEPIVKVTRVGVGEGRGEGLDPGPREQHRVDEPERVVQHDAGRNEHEPAQRELMQRPGEGRHHSDPGDREESHLRPTDEPRAEEGRSRPATSRTTHAIRWAEGGCRACGATTSFVPKRCRAGTPLRQREGTQDAVATIEAASVRPSPTSKPPCEATSVTTTIDAGTSTRTIVSVTVLGTNSAPSTTAHTAHRVTANQETHAIATRARFRRRARRQEPREEGPRPAVADMSSRSVGSTAEDLRTTSA